MRYGKRIRLRQVTPAKQGGAFSTIGPESTGSETKRHEMRRERLRFPLMDRMAMRCGDFGEEFFGTEAARDQTLRSSRPAPVLGKGY